jgi:purine-binding chemotaxis protein CheW
MAELALSSGSLPILLFACYGVRFALPAAQVREILWMPALSPLVDVPDYVLGAMSLRGDTLPVVDLYRRLTGKETEIRPTDQVIVLETRSATIAVRVERTEDVVTVESSVVRHLHDFRADETRFVSERIARRAFPYEDGTVLYIEPDDLIGFSPADSSALNATVDGAPLPEELSNETSGQTLFVVVRIGGEALGVPLGAIREFHELQRTTPVPCCPEYIVGVLNVGGEVLVVIDVSFALMSKPSTRRETTKIAVVDDGRIVVGVLVEEVLDVVTTDAEGIRPVEHSVLALKSEYMTGVIEYDGQWVGVVDLKALVGAERWIVDETV